MKKILSLLAGALIASATGSSLAAGASITASFACLSNQAGSCQESAPALSLTVSDAGNGNVSFIFGNNFSSGKSSIASIYFDNSSLFNYSQAIFGNSGGVHFQAGGSPAVLPGGKAEGFSADFIVSALNPGPKFGINPGETFMLTLALTSGQSFADVVDALAIGELRIGVHALGLGQYPGSFITAFDAVSPVPEPQPYAMLLGGLACIGLLRKRVARNDQA